VRNQNGCAKGEMVLLNSNERRVAVHAGDVLAGLVSTLESSASLGDDKPTQRSFRAKIDLTKSEEVGSIERSLNCFIAAS